jgi:hypothetical protein
MMEETGIEDKKTLHRYQRFSDEEAAKILVRADRAESQVVGLSEIVSPMEALEVALSKMGSYERSLVEPLIRGAIETLKNLQARSSEEKTRVGDRVPSAAHCD